MSAAHTFTCKVHSCLIVHLDKHMHKHNECVVYQKSYTDMNGIKMHVKLVHISDNCTET